MDWRIDFLFGMPRWNMVKHEVYMGANITTNSLDLAKPHWIWQTSQFLKLPSRLWGLSAIVVLGEMDDAPWWKLAGYTCCILMMIAAAWECGVRRVEEVMWKKPCCLPWLVQGRNGLIDLWREGPKKRFVWICLDLLIGCMAIHCASSGLGSSWCGGPSLWCFGRGAWARHRIDRFKMIRCDDFPWIPVNTCEFFCHICDHETRDRYNLRTTPPCRCGWLGWENITRQVWFQGSSIFSFTNFQFLCPGDRCSEGIWRSNSMQGSDDSKIIDLIL